MLDSLNGAIQKKNVLGFLSAQRCVVIAKVKYTIRYDTKLTHRESHIS